MTISPQMAKVNREWTLDEETTLRRMWVDHSSREVADALNRPRNSIIGKAHRLGLEKKAGPGIRKPPRRASGVRVPQVYQDPPSVPLPKPVFRAPAKKRMPMGDLPIPRQCQYPHGDPGEVGFHFCGHKTVSGGPYCEYHRSICYAPPKDQVA